MGIIVGIGLAGFTLGLLVGGIAWCILDDIIYDVSWDWIRWAVLVLSVVVMTAAGSYLGYLMASEASKQYVHEYPVYKQTIEASLDSENLTGFERMELVRQAAEANKELAGYQYKAQQWYGFTIDERVLELEFIDLSGEE